MIDVPTNFRSELAAQLEELISQGYVLPSTVTPDYSFPTARVTVRTYDSGGTVQPFPGSVRPNGKLA